MVERHRAQESGRSKEELDAREEQDQRTPRRPRSLGEIRARTTSGRLPARLAKISGRLKAPEGRWERRTGAERRCRKWSPRPPRAAEPEPRRPRSPPRPRERDGASAASPGRERWAGRLPGRFRWEKRAGRDQHPGEKRQPEREDSRGRRGSTPTKMMPASR